MKLNVSILSILMACFLSGCSKYTISSQGLVEQLKTHQKIAPNTYFKQFSLVGYPSNNLEKIKYQDKSGNYVWLYPDKNAGFIITRKSTGEKVRAYFDTVPFKEDTLYGLRSKLMGGLRVIPVADISKVVDTAEFPRMEPVTK